MNIIETLSFVDGLRIRTAIAIYKATRLVKETTASEETNKRVRQVEMRTLA